MSVRTGYCTRLLALIDQFKPDIILLSGFMLKITDPLLWYCDIINVHPADLSIKGENGKPKYIGDDAVRMAIEAGEKYGLTCILNIGASDAAKFAVTVR